MNASQSFVEALCTQADTAMKAGDFSLVNRLAAQPSLKHYFDNVFKLKAMTYESWSRDYPMLSASLDSLRASYDAELAEKEKLAKLMGDVASLNEKFDKLMASVSALAEQQAPKAKVKAKEQAPPEEEPELTEETVDEPKDE